MKLDWTDVSLHVLAAILGVAAIVAITGSVAAALFINMLFWPLREFWQHRTDPMHILAGKQSRAEWVAPVAAGALCAGLIGVFF